MFPCGPAFVEVSADGVVTGVAHRSRPGTSYLESAGEVRARRAGRPVHWSAPVVDVDVDEVEVTRSDGPLRLVVRHTFAAGWGLRVALSNLGEDVLDLDDALLTWRTPADRPVWAVAAGAAGSVAVLSPDGRGPVLGGVLRLGALTGVSAAGLHLGPVSLAPQGRYVVQWQWDFHPSPRAFDRGRHPDVPRRLDLLVDEVTILAASEDEALLAQGLDQEAVRDGVELSAAAPGRYPVELRSARGVTSFALRVAEPLEAVLLRSATALLDRPRTAAGVVPLPDVDAALAVQRALGSGLLAEAEVAEEALDLFTARLPEDAPADPRTLGHLCGEHARTGDPELLGRARQGVLAAAAPAPGLGLAATELCLALLLAGQPVAPVLEHLVGLAQEHALPPAASPADAQAALLELEVVTMARPAGAGGPVGSGRPDGPGGEDAVAARVAALGGWLGGGLKGRAAIPVPLDRLAHLATVLGLLPEPVSAALRGRWGCTAHELARRGRTEVLCRLDGDASAGPALSWLVLGTRPG